MPANQTRGTPGLLLLGFACALLLAAAAGWKLRRESRGTTVAVALTGVGDTRLYTTLSENDFLNPALIFSRAPQGLFRRAEHPVPRDDASMLRVETEQTGRHIVYTEARPEPTRRELPPRAGISRPAKTCMWSSAQKNRWPRSRQATGTGYFAVMTKTPFQFSGGEAIKDLQRSR